MPEKPDKILPALYGGLIIGAISGMPVISIVNCFCCAGVLFGGFMSVMFYKNELTAAMSPLTSSDSIQLGSIAGLFGALFGTILHIMTLLAMGNVTGDIILDMLHNLNLPPEAMDQIERSMEQSGELTGFSTAISFVTSLVIDPLFGLLGGLIGYSVFKPKQQMMNVQPPPPSAPSQPQS